MRGGTRIDNSEKQEVLRNGLEELAPEAKLLEFKKVIVSSILTP